MKTGSSRQRLSQIPDPQRLSLGFEGSVINYVLTKSSRRKKTISITISREKGVVVCAPKITPVREIAHVVAGRTPWIKKKVDEARQQNLQSKKEYVNGGLFKFMGHDWPLVIKEIPTARVKPARFKSGCLVVDVPPKMSSDDKVVWIKKSLKRCFQPRAKQHIGRVVSQMSKRLRVKPGIVKTKNLKRSWGICTHDKISFNWRLIMAPTSLLEYVVAHELCHLKHKNHSHAFYAYLGTVLPDYKERRRELQELSPYLEL